MLVGISNDIINLGTCFSMFVYKQAFSHQTQDHAYENMWGEIWQPAKHHHHVFQTCLSGRYYSCTKPEFTLVSTSRWLAEIWLLNRQGATGELEVEFKSQRCSRKLSCLFLPHCQSTPESLLAGVFKDQDKHKVNEKAKKKREQTQYPIILLVCKGFIAKRTVFPSKTKVGILEQAREACVACLGRQPIRTQDSFHVAHLQDQP